MPKKKKSNVDIWLERETGHKRVALENASRRFDANDALTVNTLEAIYGQESSFGKNMKARGITEAAGHFQFRKVTAERYGLTVSKKNDQRFDIDDASYAAANYLKDLDKMFSKRTILTANLKTRAVRNKKERKIFVFAAYNAGEGNIAKAQNAAHEESKNPASWDTVKNYLKEVDIPYDKIREILGYIPKITNYEIEFAEKSFADKNAKLKKPKKKNYRCTNGRWRTIDDQPVMICD